MVDDPGLQDPPQFAMSSRRGHEVIILVTTGNIDIDLSVCRSQRDILVNLVVVIVYVP